MAQILFNVESKKKKKFHSTTILDGTSMTAVLNEAIDKYLSENKHLKPKSNEKEI